ncbi:MAG: hypothetical protein ACP5KN_14885, partial [Armatimonadota bacterium]
MMPRITLIALTTALAAAWAPAANDLGLVPEPAYVQRAGGRIEFGGARVTALGAGPTVEYAQAVLGEVLPEANGAELPVVVQIADDSEEIDRFARLHPADDDGDDARASRWPPSRGA